MEIIVQLTIAIVCFSIMYSNWEIREEEKAIRRKKEQQRLYKKFLEERKYNKVK